MKPVYKLEGCRSKRVSYFAKDFQLKFIIDRENHFSCRYHRVVLNKGHFSH